MDVPTAAAIGLLVPRALEAARKALRDADDKEIPPHLKARLQRVRATSGTLPPPLVRPLVEALDGDAWLRERAIIAWPEAAGESPESKDHASALFLLRPEGWGTAFAAAAMARATSEAETRADRAGQRADDAVEATRAAKRRERDAEKRARQAEAARREIDRAQREPVRALRAEETRAEAALGEATAAWEAERLQREAETTTLEESVGALREEVRFLRAARAEAERVAQAAVGGASWTDREAVALAEYLDQVALQARPSRKFRSDDPPHESLRFRLPAGVRPDEAAAIDAVVRWGGPIALIVDGYNVGLQVVDEPAAARERLWAVGTRLVTAGSLLVSLVWDSRDGEHRVTRQRGLEMRFAGPGTTADDEIVAMLASASRPAVVVTSDRELRERSIARGATVVQSEALIAWASQRG
ncbi:MAG TPA: NYN domain-containing protein [Acidimicrobiia bacterium]|nr:NYN domain-containing protein [Acidimicrobiia bacterium]